jgi:hypothetical protein
MKKAAHTELNRSDKQTSPTEDISHDHNPSGGTQDFVDASSRQLIQRKKLSQLGIDSDATENDDINSNLPSTLRGSIQALSGYNLTEVKVHRNSDKPAQLNAHAYSRGNDIYLGPNQETHLPHEAWHVVQRMQGRVQPTLRTPENVPINDDPNLEHEADIMGAKAAQLKSTSINKVNLPTQPAVNNDTTTQLALKTIDDIDTNNLDQNKTAIDIGNESKGLGARTSTNKKLKTKITWGTRHNSTGDGTSVVCAPLGPDHLLGSETSNSEITDRKQEFRNLFLGDWVEAHLLNAKLGGPGDDARNLFAGSQSTNKKMESDFESKLINLVNQQGKWIYYSASVNHTAITNSDIPNIENHLSKQQRHWASSMVVTYGPVDDDGNKSGNHNTFTYRIPLPILRNSTYKKKDLKTTSVPSTNHLNNNPDAQTVIGDDRVVLDFASSIANQIDTKKRNRSEKMSEEFGSLFNDPPLSPRSHYEFVDKELEAIDPSHQGLHEHKGNTYRYVENAKKRKHLSDPTNHRDTLNIINKAKKRKLHPPQNYPGRLYKNLILLRQRGKKSLEELKVGNVYPELATIVEENFRYIEKINEESFCLLVYKFYVNDPSSFRSYFRAIRKNL